MQSALPRTVDAGILRMFDIDRRDLTFQLFDVLDSATFSGQHRFADLDRAGIEEILDTTEHLARDHFHPHAADVDRNEPEFVDGRVVMDDRVEMALNAYRDAGFFGASFDAEWGGMQLPETVRGAAAFIFAVANVSTGSYPMLTVGAANLIASFGTDPQKQRFLRPMVEGRWFGTMCLSEPQAGSSLSDITTKAVPDADGSYRLTGRKMWISGGDHELSDNIIHMVLAKIPDGPPGVKGISLFIVPKYKVSADGSRGERNDVTLAGLNHKMGYRGTVNAALNFGENDDCHGYLLGEPHKGLVYMFQMMNEARIGVGLGAVALGAAGYRASLAYALDRRQGRHPDGKDAASGQVPIVEHADIRRLLLAQKASTEGALALVLYASSLVDIIKTTEDQNLQQQNGLLLDLLTPVCKSWPSEFCLEANKHAIQILGGYGYTRDYPVERYYRDNRLNPIHEGTHGIQGLDLLGRKVVQANGAGLKLLGGKIAETIASAKTHDDLAFLATTLESELQQTLATTRKLAAEMHNSPRLALANATLYLDMFGHVVIAWMWLRQASAAAELLGRNEGDQAFLRGKLQACRYFYAHELPHAAARRDILNRIDDTTMNMQTDWF